LPPRNGSQAGAVNGDPLRQILFFTDVPNNIPMEEDRFNRIEEEHITSRCHYAITGKSAENKAHLPYSQANPSGPQNALSLHNLLFLVY
jgi:hypothetical protein